MATLSMLKDDMALSKVVGICSTYEKLFKFAQSTKDDRNIEFAKKFIDYSAMDAGYTTAKLISICENSFETYKKVNDVIDKYK